MSSKPIPISLRILIFALIFGVVVAAQALREPLGPRSTPGVTVATDGLVSLPVGEELILVQLTKSTRTWTVTYDGESVVTMHSEATLKLREQNKRVYVPQEQYVPVVFGPFTDNLVMNVADDGTAHVRYPTKFMSDWKYIPAYD